MMMDCPRCGFNQPKDTFCANCGLNIEHYKAKPKPLLVRLLQNPNLHLSLIGVMIVLVIGWIFYTQSSVVKREVNKMLDIPISSKDAADPNEVDTRARNRGRDQSANTQPVAAEVQAPPNPAEAVVPSTPPPSADEPDTEGNAGASGNKNAKAKAAAGTNGAQPRNFDASNWEIPREALMPLLAGAQQVGGSQAARAYYVAQGSKLLESLQTQAQPLSSGKSAPIQDGAQLTFETAANAPEMMQFGFAAQLLKQEGREPRVRWQGTMVLPQPEAPGETQPTMRATMDATLNGSSQLAPGGVIVIVIEPPNRQPREEYLARAGEGPWTVLASPEFRSGLTDWVMILQLK